MPTFLIVLACIAGLLAAVCGLGLTTLAAADAEGMGGDYALVGLGIALLGSLAFAGFGASAPAAAASRSSATR